MPRLDHIYEGASPVSISQPGLIRLSGPARAIALDVLRVNSLQTGAYVSRFRGRGMEFDESRPYQPGDDPRSIDWRVTARSTTAYTKLFREERERPVLVALVEPAAQRRPGVDQGLVDDLDPRPLLVRPAGLLHQQARLDEAVRVARSEVDYLGVGPVYGTRSKANPAPPLGLDTLDRIVRAVQKPIIAIGTITVDRVAEVLQTGVHGVAVLSAVASDPDPEEAVRRFRIALDGCT